MTGEELYQIYVRHQLIQNNCECDAWDDLQRDERCVWIAIAEELKAL